jgi:dTDP-4-amino-4,6-dideoxygalactose transaminase
MQNLAMQGIASKIYYPVPCHRQSAFLTQNTPCLPVSESAAKRVLSLPLFPHIVKKEIETVVGAVRAALAFPSRQLNVG